MSRIDLKLLLYATNGILFVLAILLVVIGIKRSKIPGPPINGDLASIALGTFSIFAVILELIVLRLKQTWLNVIHIILLICVLGGLLVTCIMAVVVDSKIEIASFLTNAYLMRYKDRIDHRIVDFQSYFQCCGYGLNSGDVFLTDVTYLSQDGLKCPDTMDFYAIMENNTDITDTEDRMSASDYRIINNDTFVEVEESDKDTVTMMSILLVGVFLSLLIFLSVAGNILVCIAIYTDRGLRRIGNLFLASLAIADLFVASLVMTFAGVNDLLGYWIFGSKFCDTWIAFDVMCSTASILNLCAISLDRYIHIKDPLRYGRWVTRRVALATIATIWLLAALISFVPIMLGLHRPPQPFVIESGGQNYPTCALDLTPTYAVVSSCISFYVPCIVMLGIYCRLYCYAQKHVKNIRAITRPIDIPNSTSKKKSMKQKNKALHIHLHNHQSSPYHVSDHKAAVTVGIIMGVFLICWVPFFCINIVAAFCKTCIPDITFKILTWLGYSNSAFNPIIYSIFNTEFREAFKRILTARYPDWCKCGYQSVSLNNEKYVTDYGTKTLVVNARRNGSFGEYSSEHLSCESVRQTRVNSAADVLDEVSDI